MENTELLVGANTIATPPSVGGRESLALWRHERPASSSLPVRALTTITKGSTIAAVGGIIAMYLLTLQIFEPSKQLTRCEEKDGCALRAAPAT